MIFLSVVNTLPFGGVAEYWQIAIPEVYRALANMSKKKHINLSSNF
jgi:hypothetical protein